MDIHRDPHHHDHDVYHDRSKNAHGKLQAHHARSPARKSKRRLDDEEGAVVREMKRGKRMRREPSAASITMLFPEHHDEHLISLHEEIHERDADDVPGYLRDEVVAAVKDIEDAKPVGGQEHLIAVHKLRQILSMYDEPPYKAAVEAGAVPVLMQALQPPQMDSTALETTFQAAWALTNLAVGDSEVVKAVVKAAPILISYVGGDNGMTIAEQCAWAIGNIAEEDVEYRTTLIANGAVGPLTTLIIKSCKAAVQNKLAGHETISAGETAAWALSSLFKGEGSEIQEFIQVEDALGTVLKCLGHGTIPHSFVRELFWILVRVTNMLNSEHGIMDLLINNGILYIISSWLDSLLEVTLEGDNNGQSALVPVLRVTGNILSSDATQVAKFFCNEDEGINAVRNIVLCAESRQYSVQREAAWALACIAGLPGTKGSKVIQQVNGFPVLMKLLKHEPFHVKKEAAFALANICAGGGGGTGDAESLNYLFGGDKEATSSMLSLMRSADQEAVKLGLQFTEMLLRELPQGKDQVESSEGIQLLEEVQFGTSTSKEMKAMAQHIVNHYWGITAEKT